MPSAGSTSTGSSSARCHRRDREPEAARRRRCDWNGRWLRASLRARSSRHRGRDRYRPQADSNHAREAGRGAPSRLCGLSALAGALTGQDAAVFCQGAYTGAVPDAEFRRITVDFAVEFARVLRASSPAAAFSFLSGNGADPTGRSQMAFARYRGEAETALPAAGSPRLYIFRPAYIYPVEPRREPNFSYRLLRAVYPAFRVLFANQVIRADDLARAMVDAALFGAEHGRTVVLENRDIRRLASAAPSPH